MKSNVFLGETRQRPQKESRRALGSSDAGSDVDCAGMNELSSQMNESCGARAVDCAASVDARLSHSLSSGGARSLSVPITL